MLFSILYTVAAWLGASALFIGVPVAVALRGDVRRLRAAGIENAGAVVRRRFFVPLRVRSLPHVAGRPVWIEWGSPRVAHGRGVATVLEVTKEALVVGFRGERMIFVPRNVSRRFAAGEGAATGRLRENGASALLVLLT